MSLVCLCSAHGAPGVTTTALALAGVWPESRPLVLMEADPFGGVLAARFGLGDTPGMASLAAVARRGLDKDMVWRHAQQLPGGIPLLVGPPAPDQAQLVLRDLAAAAADWCAGAGAVDVIADCGRLTSGSPVVQLLQRADAVLVVARPTVDQLRSASYRIRTPEMPNAGAVLLLVGDTPYGPGEVASTLGVEVVGAMAWDPRTAQTLSGAAGGRDVRRSPLVRSAASLAERLTEQLGEAPAGADETPVPASGTVRAGRETGR